MAGVTALRDAARDALEAAGGRGFVRFLSQGDALLVSDANRRGDEARLKAALENAGFSCEVREGLLHITPGDGLLLRLCGEQAKSQNVDWAHPLFEAQALAARLLWEERLALDEGGRRLVLSAARLLWQPREKVIQGLPVLRGRIAVCLREGKRSGLYETGRLLCGWLAENGK